MGRCQVNSFDLVDVVICEMLPVYKTDGRLAEHDYEGLIKAKHPRLSPILPKQDNHTIYELILNSDAYDFKISHTHPDPNYIPLANRIEQLMFKLIEVERF
jgi:hypothetical protein